MKYLKLSVCGPHHKAMSKYSKYFFVALMAALLGGCTGRILPGIDQAGPLQDDHVAIVQVSSQDTLESLARQYLGDSRKAWQIAEYNRVMKAEAGRRLVIPLKPVVRGGLRVDGYQTVPVLLYPHIAADGKMNRGLSAAAFDGQLQVLRDKGFHTVSLEDLNGFLDLEERLPTKSIVITFDSARTWVFQIAYPALKKFGFKAAVFVPTGLIGKSGYMGWNDLAAMAADGFDIGANGATARSLATLAKEDGPAAYLRALEEEIVQPCAAITGNLKQDCRYFAYPAGRSNDLIVGMLKKSGYKMAFSRQSGSNPFFVDNYKVRRFVVANAAEGAQLLNNLETFVPMELR